MQLDTRARGSADDLSYLTNKHWPLERAAAVAAAGGAQITSVLDDNSTDGGSSDLSRAERLSLPVTLIVLLIAFGALVAALVPVLLGATAVIAAFGLLGPISQVFALDSSVKTVVLLIGMAVGVDYALFYVIRSREERARGLASHQALEHRPHVRAHGDRRRHDGRDRDGGTVHDRNRHPRAAS